MAISIGALSVETVEDSAEIIREFLNNYLIPKAERIGSRCALGFYREGSLEQMARDYAKDSSLSKEDTTSLLLWISDLPWPDNDYLALAFNW